MTKPQPFGSWWHLKNCGKKDQNPTLHFLNCELNHTPKLPLWPLRYRCHISDALNQLLSVNRIKATITCPPNCIWKTKLVGYVHIFIVMRWHYIGRFTTRLNLLFLNPLLVHILRPCGSNFAAYWWHSNESLEKRAYYMCLKTPACPVEMDIHKTRTHIYLRIARNYTLDKYKLLPQVVTVSCGLFSVDKKPST